MTKFELLSIEELLAVANCVLDPRDLLSLSSTNRCLATAFRNEWPWRYRLLNEGWCIVALRSNQDVMQTHPPIAAWLLLAQGACQRYCLLHPGTFESPASESISPIKCPLELQRPVSTRKLVNWTFNVTSQMDSNHDFYARTRSLPFTIAANGDRNPTDEVRFSRILLSYVYYDVSAGQLALTSDERLKPLMSRLLTNDMALTNNFLACESEQARRLAAMGFCCTSLRLVSQLPSHPGGRPLPQVKVPWRALANNHRTLWTGPHWDTRWSSREPLHLVGYYTYYRHWLDPLGTMIKPNEGPSRWTLRRDMDDPTHIWGKGSDAPGAFTMEGSQIDGDCFALAKHYPHSNGRVTWRYHGMLTPWGLTGQWSRDNEVAPPKGEFYFWIDDQR